MTDCPDCQRGHRRAEIVTKIIKELTDSWIEPVIIDAKPEEKP